MPAVVSSEIAMLRAVTQEGIASAEAHLRDLVTWMLVTRSSCQITNSEIAHSDCVIEEAFRVCSRTTEFDEINWISIIVDDILGVSSHRIDEKGKLLVEMHVARRNIVKHWRVAEAILDSALVLTAFNAAYRRLIGIVVDVKIKADGLTLIVSNKMTAEAIHVRYGK